MSRNLKPDALTRKWNRLCHDLTADERAVILVYADVLTSVKDTEARSSALLSRLAAYSPKLVDMAARLESRS